MIWYLGRRLAQAVVVVLIASFIVFLMSHATGDPATLLLPLDATQETQDAYRQRWGLDQPLLQQFATWVGNVAQGDLGTSFRARVPVTTLIAERLPRSIALAVAALAVAWVVGVVTGLVSALRRGTWLDWAFRGFAILGQGVPAFWLALVLQSVLTVRFPLFPVAGADSVASIVLPAATLGWFISAGVMRLVRSAMLTALGSDYVLLARSKGLRETLVISKHALRNALIAPLTFLGVYVGVLIGSAVVVESIFAWPGVGSLAYQAVLSRDFPTLQGVILVVTVLVAVTSVVIDLSYAVIDPRVRG